MGINLMKGCHVLPILSHFVFLHIILRRSQMLLTFSRHQIMYNVSNVVLCAEVTYNGYFVIQQQHKEQNEALDL